MRTCQQMNVSHKGAEVTRGQRSQGGRGVEGVEPPVGKVGGGEVLGDVFVFVCFSSGGGERGCGLDCLLFSLCLSI